MSSYRNKQISNSGIFFIIWTIIILSNISVVIPLSQAGQTDNTPGVSFFSALNAKDDSKALSVGDAIFTKIEQKYGTDSGFRAFKSKMNAAQFLADQMQKQLKSATNNQMLSLVDQPEAASKQAVRNSLSVAPARSFYDTSIKIFSIPVRIDNLTDGDKSFLAQYYSLKLKMLTSSIAKTGQALAIAEPSFKDTHNYVLVLPLLHVSDTRPINIEILPEWMQRPDELDIFSDSCLFHFGLPFQAMSLAKKAAQIRNESFSELDFYKQAAKRCGTSYSHIAADCFQRAIEIADENDTDMSIKIQFELIQHWFDSRNYALAAGQAKQIHQNHPDHKDAGKAIWFYYYSLSRTNSVNEILVDIDQAMDDKRCKEYMAQLMYIKWWALRRSRDQKARVAAIEHELLKNYKDNPMVAPIMLSQATDLMAKTHYSDASVILNELVRKFPKTSAAIQAKKMLDQMNKPKNLKSGS